MSPEKLLKPVLLALACGVLLAGLNLQTADVIADNQRLHEQQLFRTMVESVTTSPELQEFEHGFQVYEAEQLVATIHRKSTQKGYNGNISLLVAFTPEGEILSARVSDHTETPGIGDKIDVNVSPWMYQFAGASRGNTNWLLSPDGDVDGITGATITSRAVKDAILESLPQ